MLTQRTVNGYASQVLDKLDVADRTQAALLAQGERGAPPDELVIRKNRLSILW